MKQFTAIFLACAALFTLGYALDSFTFHLFTPYLNGEKTLSFFHALIPLSLLVSTPIWLHGRIARLEERIVQLEYQLDKRDGSR
ncbi:hypothetical protein D1159_02250 [Pseudoflavonifractor sp. 524-17]|uniref:hypothetical protein n=1 Tax=Pseudoflavonifractor sp. 524-17 TaxID=2304577 RepID=UPI00137B91EF|nr:hypothetical protein [Pseudoflavonifractor sp. 524-17]NCE63428.1 hypothetical protein [Pseudoflavonifractor sp. 524-17]